MIFEFGLDIYYVFWKTFRVYRHSYHAETTKENDVTTTQFYHKWTCGDQHVISYDNSSLKDSITAAITFLKQVRREETCDHIPIPLANMQHIREEQNGDKVFGWTEDPYNSFCILCKKSLKHK